MCDAGSSPVHDRRDVGQPSAPAVSNGSPFDCLTYFWQLIEANTLYDVDSLWLEFQQRSRELRQLASQQNISMVVWHLGRSLYTSSFWTWWPLQDKRAAILDVLAAASVRA
jgi:hypothetical protein